MDLTDHEVAAAAAAAGANADEIMKKMAEHKGCETDSDGGKKSQLRYGCCRKRSSSGSLGKG